MASGLFFHSATRALHGGRRPLLGVALGGALAGLPAKGASAARKKIYVGKSLHYSGAARRTLRARRIPPLKYSGRLPPPAHMIAAFALSSPSAPPMYLSQGFYPRIFLSILPTTRSSPLVPCSPLTPSLPLCPAYRNSQFPSASHRPRKIPRALPQAPRSALSSHSASSPTRASAP